MESNSNALTVSPILIEKAKWLVKEAKAFNSVEVIKRIQEQEMQKIKQEGNTWKIVGAVAGLALGLSDGFDFQDLLYGLGGSAVAGNAHALASDEQVKFLQQINAYWIVDGGSPADIARRVGPAKSRLLAFTPGSDKPFSLYNHHRGNRGDYLVKLSTSGQTCDGWNDPKAFATLTNNFTEDRIRVMSKELYPTMEGTFKADGIRQVQIDEALSCDLNASFIVDNAVKPVIVDADGGQRLFYRADIPIHSDF